MKLVLEDFWCDGVHYDRVELFTKDIDEDSSRDDIIEEIVSEFIGEDVHKNKKPPSL